MEAFYPEILQGSWLENDLIMEWARGRARKNIGTGLGMIVTTDLGEWTEVHYRNKKPAGERFAALALKRFYGK